jgi:hypothetical protein
MTSHPSRPDKHGIKAIMIPVKHNWVVYKREGDTVTPMLQPDRSQRPSREVTIRDRVRHSSPLEPTFDGCQVHPKAEPVDESHRI